MSEPLRDFIQHVASETEKSAGWLEFEAADGTSHLVAGDLACHGDGVSFEDDSGFLAELAYRDIAALRTGRQGDPGLGRRRLLPLAAGLAA